MNFSVERAPLLDALQKVQSAVEKKNTVQILGNILCTVVDRELSLCATDLEVGIKVNIPVKTGQSGKITLSAKHFFDIVREFPDKDIHVTQKENNWVEILCGKSRFNIVGIAPDDFPALPIFEEKKYYDARAEALIDMIDKTEFAASTDATRYNLNGIFLEQLESTIMRMTATDGHRLSLVDREVFLHSCELKKGIIIPKKGVGELRKILAESNGTVGIAFERGYIFAKVQNCYLFVRMIEGEYPDYRPVVPKNADKVVKINRGLFTSALRRVSLLAHEKSKSVKLAFQTDNLVITCSNPDMGEAREELDISYTGEPIEIGFNSKYLLECISVLKSDQVDFCLKDRLSPGILRSSDQPNHTYVIMPMRL